MPEKKLADRIREAIRNRPAGFGKTVKLAQFNLRDVLLNLSHIFVLPSR